jgi:hypothetical protein
MSKTDQKFGKFLIGILFGDKKKQEYERVGLSEEHLERKQELKTIINKHLKAAEKLSMDEALESITEKSNKIKPKKSVNRRLGTILYPPERALKFETILKEESSQLKNLEELENQNISNGIKTEDLRYMRTKPNRRGSENSQNIEPVPQNLWEKPTLCDESPDDLNDFLNFAHLPKKYFHHWRFLKEKVEFYQKRLKKFYKTLNKLAMERIKKERENLKPFDLNPNNEYFHRNPSINTFQNQVHLSKRGEPDDLFNQNEQSYFSSRKHFNRNNSPYYEN